MDEFNSAIHEAQHGDHGNSNEINVDSINQILNGIATLSNHIKELDNKTSKANEEILQLKKKIESNELKREPNNGECNHEMPKWNETDCKKITSIFEHWESEYPNLKFHFPTDLENWAFKQDPSKCNIFPYMSNGIWRICIISIDDSQIFTINPFFESDEELNDFMMNVVPLKRYKIVNIARESSKNTDNSLIIVIKFLDKLLSNDESLTSILNGWKRNRSVKKIQQQIDDMDKSEIKIYETYIESLINQPLLTKESVTTRTKTDVTETPNPNDENVPIIVGNLDPPKLIKECDLLEWNNELTNYFFNNQIPNQLQLKIAALDRDSRAKVVMAQKYNFLILRDRNELISYLFKQSKGVDIGVCFRGMTRHHDESPSHFMQRLDNLYSAAFPDSPEERRNHEIGEQFIAGIDNEQMSRILLSIPNRTIPKLLQTVEEREKVNISINEIKTRGLMNKASVNQLKHADGVHRTNNEFTRKKQKFAIKECKFCKSNKCKIHDRSCSYCWKGNCRKHITFQKNYDSPKFERNEVNVIKTTNKHDLMCINVIINQHNIVALIDSGSTISLLHERWCKKLEINQFPTNTKLVSFTGTEVNATGNAIICVEIDNRRLTQNFTISNDINYDAIIGYDFLKKFKLSIDAANGLLYWEDEINEINSVDTSFEQIGDLKVIENEDIRKEVTKILTNPPKNVLRTEHKIDVETQSSISCQTRRFPRKTMGIFREILTELEENRIIRRSSSPWRSNAILVKKKDDKFRLVVDYIPLNGVTISDRYPLPRTDNILRQLHNKKIFSTIDLLSGFHQILMKEEDKCKTAFITPNGLFEFNYMPFGLKNAPSTFQRIMDELLQNAPNTFTYLDDVIIATEDNAKNHIKSLLHVITIIHDHGLRINFNKCQFVKNEVTYLGHIVSGEGIKLLRSNIDTLKKIPTPKSKKDVRALIGIANYYRKFVPAFSDVTKPMTSLLKNSCEMNWTQEQDRAKEKLIEMLSSPPVLKYPNYEKDFILICDASSFAMSGVLCQMDNDMYGIVEYFSKRFTKSQERWHINHKEACAIVESLKYFHYFVYGYSVIIKSDSKQAIHLLIKFSENDRVARWKESISIYSLKFVHVKGADNILADMLSRQINYISKTPANNIKENLIDKLKEEQKKDAWLTDFANNENRVVTKNGLKTITSRRNDINQTELNRIIIPSNMLEIVVKTLHEDPYFFHRGTKAMTNVLTRKFYHPKLKKVIRTTCFNCNLCKKNKYRNTRMRHRTLLRNDKLPFDNVQIDIKGPLVPSENKNKYIVIMIDSFTKFVEFYPIRQHNCQEIMKCFRSFISTFGIPWRITTDAGSEFRSKLFDNECNMLGIIRRTATTEHHETIGLAERSLRTLNEMLRIATSDDQSNWEDTIHYLKFTLNNTPSNSTKYSPSELIFRKKPNHPNILLRLSEESETSNRIINTAWKNIQNKTTQSQSSIDQKQKFHKLLKGDKVRIRLHHQSTLNEKSAKLCNLYSEQFVVLEAYENGNVRIIDENDNEIIRHTNDLVKDEPQRRSNRGTTRNYQHRFSK